MRAAAVLLVLLAACGDRTDTAVRRDDRPAASTPVLREGAAAGTTVPAAPEPPAAFATMCVTGDPAVGAAWVLGGVNPALSPVAVELIEAMASRDSARLAARIARTVDVMPSDTASGDFRGLPVVVRAAWRLVPLPGDTIVVALVARRMPMESNPLEELFFLVAVPGLRQGVRDPLLHGWVVREVATEETAAVRELLAAYAATDVLTLVLAWEGEQGVRTELLSRRAAAWRLDWSGPLAGCTP